MALVGMADCVGFPHVLSTVPPELRVQRGVAVAEPKIVLVLQLSLLLVVILGVEIAINY